jgi:hypothetical protein
LSHRIQIVLPEPLADQLNHTAQTEGVAPATLAARLVRERLQHHGALPQATIHHRHAAGRPSGGSSRPHWLEPYGGSGPWRAETWGAIVALHARYPQALGGLKDGWWDDAAHLESLCALAAWRAQLDVAAADPREELAFQDRLHEYGHQLRTEAGGVTRAWQPGAPPAHWSATSATRSHESSA